MLQMTRSGRARLASRVTWTLSAVMTSAFFISANDLNMWQSTITIAISFGVQFLLSEIESSLFSGKIPMPWQKGSSRITNAILFGAIGATLVDTAINLGGTGYFARNIRNSAVGDVLVNEFAASNEVLTTFIRFFTVFFALLFSLGPELLMLYADHLDTKPGVTEARSKRKFEEPEEQQPVRKTTESIIESIKRKAIEPERNSR